MIFFFFVLLFLFFILKPIALTILENIWIIFCICVSVFLHACVLYLKFLSFFHYFFLFLFFCVSLLSLHFVTLSVYMSVFSPMHTFMNFWMVFCVNSSESNTDWFIVWKSYWLLPRSKVFVHLSSLINLHQNIINTSKGGCRPQEKSCKHWSLFTKPLP